MKTQESICFDTEEEAYAFLLANANVYQSGQIVKADDGDCWIALLVPY